jgi:hypothetical protein
MMVIADYPRELPHTVLVLPELNKLRLTHRLGVVMSRMVKAVSTHFQRALTLYRIHLQASGNKLPTDLATDIVFDTVGELLLGEG